MKTNCQGCGGYKEVNKNYLCFECQSLSDEGAFEPPE